VLDGGASLLELVSERMSTLGAPVQAELPGGVILTGNAVGLDNSGALLITDAAGTTHAVAAGDVIHLRRGAASGGPVEYA
jgi:BirA family biotin operon repressor/biotin-[acetyl-CoA-carboxylase] ligase